MAKYLEIKNDKAGIIIDDTYKNVALYQGGDPTGHPRFQAHAEDGVYKFNLPNRKPSAHGVGLEVLDENGEVVFSSSRYYMKIIGQYVVPLKTEERHLGGGRTEVIISPSQTEWVFPQTAKVGIVVTTRLIYMSKTSVYGDQVTSAYDILNTRVRGNRLNMMAKPYIKETTMEWDLPMVGTPGELAFFAIDLTNAPSPTIRGGEPDWNIYAE